MGHGSAGAGRSHLSLPYFLGCPSWSEPAWRDYFYPQTAATGDFLGLYGQCFNAVEGNTTFYAAPSVATVERWARQMPAGFRFTAKFPREISHGGDLREQLGAAQSFIDLMRPLGTRVSPFWLQLPASFTPDRLIELAAFIEALAVPLAVEVRHPQFFAREDDERALNRLLAGAAVERICLDARALFSCQSRDPAVLHAQSKKPHLPVRPTAFSHNPQVRFIGHPQLEANVPFLKPWADKVSQWITDGHAPFVFLHTPDNRQAAALAWRFHAMLMERLPGLPALAIPSRDVPGRQLELI